MVPTRCASPIWCGRQPGAGAAELLSVEPKGGGLKLVSEITIEIEGQNARLRGGDDCIIYDR